MGNPLQLVVNATDLKELFYEWKEESSTQGTQVKKETYMSPEEVSNYYHVSKVSLWRWAKNGILVPVKVGRKTYYRQSDIDKIFNPQVYHE